MKNKKTKTNTPILKAQKNREVKNRQAVKVRVMLENNETRQEIDKIWKEQVA